MKLYFAKRLPVEGPINEHDVVFKDSETGVAVHVYPNKEAYEVELFRGKESLGSATYPASRVKASKLYLCSRDIQANDRLRSFTGKSEIPVVFGCEEEKKALKTAIENQHLFKVVGEISSDAVWVEEGDEFLGPESEKDCEIFPIHTHDDDTEEMIYTDKNGNKVDMPIYMIKHKDGKFY